MNRVAGLGWRPATIATSLLLVAGCTSSGSDSAPTSTVTSTATATVTSTTTETVDDAAVKFTPLPEFCRRVRQALGSGDWRSNPALFSPRYDDLNLRRVRLCGLRDGDLWVDWTLKFHDFDIVPGMASDDLFTIVKLAQGAGPFRHAHFRAYWPIGDTAADAHVLRVVDTEFSEQGVINMDVQGYDPYRDAGFWLHADVSRAVDEEIIADAVPPPSPSE